MNFKTIIVIFYNKYFEHFFSVKANQKGLDTGRIIKFEILANSENVNMREELLVHK